MKLKRIFVKGVGIFSIVKASQRCYSSLSARTDNSLKDIAKPEKIPLDYWKKVLWVAMDLKKAVTENNKRSFKFLETQHVTLLFGKPHGRFQLAFTIACDLLGARNTLYYDGNFENQPNPADSGRVLSTMTDMFVVHGLHHDVLMSLTKDAILPVFSASCNVYCLQKALSDLMTFQERLKRLNGLTLAWVGPPTSIFNAYLLLCSKFGINIRYICLCSHGSGRMSPVHRFSSTNPSLCEKKEETVSLKEFKTAEETISGAHVIATSMHPEDKNRITLKLLDMADRDWVFMHTLPRTQKEVSDEVFYHERNLSWKTSENYLYVAMAVILTNLKDYQPKLKMPDFEGRDSCTE